MKNRYLLIVLAAAHTVLFGLVGPASAQTITVGGSLSTPPWGFKDESQKPTGIDVALCGGLIKQIGGTPEFVDLDFKSLIPALQARRFDMVCSGVFITPEREQIATLIPYVNTSQAILSKKDSKIAALADLCGLGVSLTQGSSQFKLAEAQSVECVKNGQSPVAIQAFDTNPVAVRALENGNVDAFMGSDQTVSFYLKKTNNPDLKKAVSGINPVRLGIIVRKDDTALATSLRAGLAAMKENGSYDAILKEWGIEGAGLETF